MPNSTEIDPQPIAANPGARWLNVLLDYLRDTHPRSFKGVEEALGAIPARFEEIAEMYLSWLVRARGEKGLYSAIDAFAYFTADVNLAQGRYEQDGHYESKSFAEVYANHYSQNETMTEYLLGIYLTNFLWAHHAEICVFYRDYFLARLDRGASLIEIAPGHGGWGAWALSVLPGATLQGFDISPSSIEIATTIAGGAGVGDRATYTEKNALAIGDLPGETADGLICSFLVEHLEQPGDLFAVVQHLLKPHATAFITGALTAAQVDHIYEYRRESELVLECEEHGMRVLATLSAGPKRTLPNARFLPRSMALVVQKRITDMA